MKAKTWCAKIKKACNDAGTYKPYFDEIINTLADILEKRDDAETIYRDTGSHAIVKHTNKGGATNTVVNPALSLWENLNKDALSYWRELGLTPAGLKKLNDTALDKKSDAFASALGSILG